MPEKASINKLREKDFIIYAYTNRIYGRHIDLIIFYIVFIFIIAFLAVTNNLTFKELFWIFGISIILVPIGIAWYFSFSSINYQRIILTEKDLIYQQWGEIVQKTYLLSSIDHWSLQVTEKSKKRKGLYKISPLQDILCVVFWGYLFFLLFRKKQQLVLLGKQEEKIGEIDLSDFYEQDINLLVLILKESTMT